MLDNDINNGIHYYAWIIYKALKKKHALFCTKKHKLMRNNSIEKIISRCIIMLTKKMEVFNEGA